MAAGAYQAVDAAGLLIPDDVAVIGFDNDDFVGAAAVPALTTVDQRNATIAATALDVLIGRLAGKPTPVVSTMSAEFIVRASA